MGDEYIVEVLSNDDCVNHGVLVRCINCKYFTEENYCEFYKVYKSGLGYCDEGVDDGSKSGQAVRGRN